MTAINFPSSPVNGDTLTSGNTTYTYNAAKTRWDAVTTVNGIQLNSLSVGAEAPASGDGGIAYNNTSGVFTYTPPVSADPLPSQTGNTGKYLTTDGSTTSWATVSAGAGYEIGDGLELNSVSTTSWPVSPNLVTTINGTVNSEASGRAVASTSQYTVVGRNDYSKVTIHNTSTGALLHTINNPDGVGGFGVYLDISGDNIAIAHGYANKVFIYSASTGSLVRTFTNPGSFNNFGVNAKIEGNIVAINSFGPTAGNYDGYLHVYNISTGSLLWQKANPNTDGGTTDDAFRYGLAITANYIAQGATDADTGGSNSGIVYIFDKNTGDVVRTISAPSPAVNLRFGSYLDMDGTNLVVATGSTSHGLVYLFDILTGNLLASVSNPGAGDGSAADSFAYVALDGDYLAVGANANAVGGSNSGSAYLFNISNLNSIATVYSLHGTSAGAYFGTSLSLSQGFLSIGEYSAAAGGTSRGSVRIYAADVTTADYLQPDSTIATTSYVNTAITNLVDSSPAALNTLNELAAALGDDANFSTTVTNSIASKAPLASPTFTGVPVAPTATAGTNTTQLATTAFVTAATVAAAGDTLPAQTDNAGKYLTTDGSTTSWAEIVSTGGSKEFIANGPIAAGAPVVLDPAGTVSPVATIAANGTEMAAGHQALFPAIGMTSMAIMLTHNTNYSTYKRAATCPITGRSVFFGEMSTLLNMNSNYRTRRVIQGSAPNASATEMILGPLVELSDAVAGANMHNVCFSGNGDGVFIITYQTATAYNNTASAGLAARLGKVDSSGNITMFNTETVKVGRPSNYNSQYSDSSSVANQWLNSIVWDPIASKFVIVYTGYSWLTDGVKAQTTIGTALYSYDNSNTLSPAGGQGLTSLGYYGSSNTKLKALWDSTRERVTTIFFGQDRRYLSNFTSDNYFHESIFDVIDGEIQPLVPITAPIPYVSTTTAVWAFQTDMEYNPTQGTFLLLPESSTSNESIFYSFAFDGSAVSSLVAVGRPSTLLKGIDNTGISYYRDIIYEASSDSITIAYSAPNMTYGGTHANKNSIYTATLDASDYTSVLSNIEAYDASWRGNTTLFNYGTSYARVGVAAAQYVELNWSPILNKFLMYRQTDELDSYQVNYSYTQSNSDRYRDAYDLVQVISVSNYPQAIGFSEGTVSDGTPVPVTLAGGVNTNQSGLSIERNYYFQTDGSLGINRTDYLVGLALSDTELQVADLSDLDNVNLSLYATTSALASKAPLASPTFTGVPVAPTATAGTNTTQIATTAFVAAATAATLPTQTGNTGKYLTTDGSTTSWAAVSAGAGYEIGDGLELNSVTASDWSTIPAPTASFIGTTINAQLGSLLAASSSYVVTVLRGPGTTFGVYNAQTGSFERNITKPGSGNTYYGKLDISGTKIIFGNYESSGNAGAAAIFEATTGNQIHSLSTTGTAYAGAGVAISPTYAAVNSFSADNVDSYVDIYSVSTGNKIYTISNPDIVPTGGEATFDDSFGIIISMSDSYLVVAALNEEAADGTTNSGVVYVFDTPTGTLLHTLIPSSPVANAQYGYTVALHGDYIAVGTSAGPYVFIYSASTGSLLRTISDPQPGDNKFGSGWTGSAISIDGNYLLVGAPNTNPSVELEVSGAAYLFDITNGNLLHTISATSSRQGLGSATALAPGVLAVASKYFDNGSSDSSADYGKIDLYKTNTSTTNYLQPDSTIATTSYVDTAITNLVDSSPAALNTLNELAAALGDDANFATTVTNTLATKAPLASPTFTGVPVAPTATAGTNTTQIATTAFVTAATVAAAGAGYEIGDGLELNSVTTIDWSTLPSPLTEINGIASEQYFGGIGLSASDTHIVIGTPGGAGAVTAFDVYSAETGAFLRSIEKIDPAALGDGGFGAFVSISGTKVIMGHPLAASVAGAAYIFEATTGALLHTLSAPTGGAVTTGQAVAISPNYAAVLSLTSAQTSSRIGVYNVSTGALLHTIAQVTNGNGHGSLSITDQYLVAGEPLRDRDGQPTSDNSGAVSVYNTVTGSLLHTIVEPTPSVEGDFGFSVSVHGDYIAIGGAPDTYGAVYVYSASTGSLLHTFQNPLPAETGTTYTYGFGKSVSVYGGYLLVGALDGPRPGTIGDSWGRAYLYDLTNGSLIQTIYGTSNNDQLGDSVAMGPGIIAIGVPQYDSNGLTNNGKAVIYKTDVTTADYLQPDSTIATTSSPTFTGVTTLTATSEVLQPKFSAGFGAVNHDIANGSIFYHDNMMGNFDAAFINVPTTVDLVTSAVLVMADGQMWGPSSYVRVNGTEYVVKWLGGTAPTMSADVVDVVSYSLINRNGTWVVIGSHSAYSAAV